MESGIFNCAWERPSLKWFPALLTTPLVPPQPEDHLCVALKIFRAWPSQWWRRQYCIPTDVHRHETRESADLAWEKTFKKWSNCPLPNYPRQFFSSLYLGQFILIRKIILIAFCHKVRCKKVHKTQGSYMKIKYPNIGDGTKVPGKWRWYSDNWFWNFQLLAEYMSSLYRERISFYREW